MGWIRKKLDSLAGTVIAVVAGLTSLQLPAFIHAYMQRLGGHLDEARLGLAGLKVGRTVNIAEEVFIARAKLREAGKGQQLDVLDAQSEVFGAKQDLIKVEFDSRIAVYRLALSMGTLTPQRLDIAVRVSPTN